MLEENDSTMLVVTFSDNRVFGIPLNVIANHRAVELAGRTGQQYTEEWWNEFNHAFNESVENEQDVLTDWAKTRLTWPELSPYATTLCDEATENAYMNEWSQASMEVVEVSFNGDDD